jgi:hypothetical protein
MKLTRANRSTRGKTCPSATLFPTNPTSTDPVSNPGFRGERPATLRPEPWHGLRYVLLGAAQAAWKLATLGYAPQEKLCVLVLVIQYRSQAKVERSHSSHGRARPYRTTEADVGPLGNVSVEHGVESDEIA